MLRPYHLSCPKCGGAKRHEIIHSERGATHYLSCVQCEWKNEWFERRSPSTAETMTPQQRQDMRDAGRGHMV